MATNRHSAHYAEPRSLRARSATLTMGYFRFARHPPRTDGNTHTTATRSLLRTRERRCHRPDFSAQDNYWSLRTDLLRGIPHHYHVRFHVPAPDSEFLAVERPAEAEDLFGRKLGDLPAGLPVQRLQQQITDIVFRADHID